MLEGRVAEGLRVVSGQAARPKVDLARERALGSGSPSSTHGWSERLDVELEKSAEVDVVGDREGWRALGDDRSLCVTEMPLEMFVRGREQAPVSAATDVSIV